MNLVNQHRVNIKCSEEAIAKEIQSELSSVLEVSFYPKLDKLLNLYELENQLWIIDDLTVDLDCVNSKNWRKEIVKKSLEKIEKHLQTNHPGVKIINDVINFSSSQLVLQNEKHAEELILTFLKTGMVTSNALSNSLNELFEMLNVNLEFVENVIGNVKNDFNATLRWTLNTPRHIKFEFLSVKNIAHDLNFRENSIEKYPQLNDFLEFLYWLPIFNDKATILKEPNLNRVKEIGRNYFQIDKEYVDKLLYQTSDKHLQSKTGKTHKLLAGSKNDKSSENTLVANENGLFSFYISNSGLILLHPFLPRLFEKLEFTKEGRWIDVTTQHRACVLLQYLVSFEEDIFENDLILNKILCGISLNDVVSTKIEFTGTEKEVCTILLAAVIDHWKILKSTSIETLQQIFIKREGKIQEGNNNQFELLVETGPYDMLLDQLPWGISTIKTPWMESIMICNWNL